MTAAELLARLPERPPLPKPVHSPLEQPMYFAGRSRRAEFDRALLLDAIAQHLWEENQPVGRAEHVKEAVALRNALETIVATIRSEL